MRVEGRDSFKSLLKFYYIKQKIESEIEEEVNHTFPFQTNDQIGLKIRKYLHIFNQNCAIYEADSEYFTTCSFIQVTFVLF